MDTYDWLLFLHLVAAAMAVAGVVIYWTLYTVTGPDPAAPSEASVPRTPALQLAPLADVLWSIGGLGVLVLGVALAIQVDGYEVWDAWVLAAIVLWMIAGETGRRVGLGYRNLRTGTGPRASIALHAIVALALLALLVDMIYKPGA
ncbi:MAG: hypothetical protein QOJ13_3647 [Gaiellales bacterium]|jgi:hypothetical protein|nr:hypothetical protein [Gaiellales bacterium]